MSRKPFLIWYRERDDNDDDGDDNVIWDVTRVMPSMTTNGDVGVDNDDDANDEGESGIDIGSALITVI